MVCSQLPLGITRESSRISRSQSKRVSATPLTDARRVSLIWEKFVNDPR